LDDFNQLERLIHPLQPFAKHRAQKLKAAMNRYLGIREEKPQIDWRQKSKQRQQMDGLIGDYQVEELEL
jgi:hypothetical protein